MEEVQINTRKWRIKNKSVENNYRVVTKIKVLMVLTKYYTPTNAPIVYYIIIESVVPLGT